MEGSSLMDGSGFMSTSGFIDTTNLIAINGTMNDSNTTELDCEVMQYQGAPVPLNPTPATVMRLLQAIYYIIATPVGLSLNGFVILLIAKFKKLQNITFYLILQIIGLDIIIALTLYPVTAANVLADSWVFGGSLCTVIGFILFFLRYSRNFLIVVLLTDRLCTVYCPFWYPKHRIQIVAPFSISVWILSFVISLCGVRGILDCYSFQRFTYNCVFSLGCEHQDECGYFRIFAITLSTSCLAVSFILYVMLFIKAKKLKTKVAPPVTCSEMSRTDNSEETTLLKTHQKSERRATVTIIILFFAVLGVSIPTFFFFALGPVILRELGIQRPPEAYVITSIISRSAYSILVILDPIALMRNADMREIISKGVKDLKRKLRSLCVK